MARPRTGTLRRQPTAQGVSYGVQFRYRGTAHYVHLGGSWDGWDAARAENERQFLMEKVNRGEWSPPRREAETGPPADVPTFQLFASEWLYRTRQTLPDPDGKTARDLEWRLSVVMDKFGPVAVDRIDEALAEDLVADLRAERLAIEHAREQGQPLVETYVDARTGRTHRRRRRGLSNSSINKALGCAERVLRAARRRRLIDDVPDLRSAGLRPERPRRSFLEPEQIVALLEAASALENAARGLDWQKVRHIRASTEPAVTLARELAVSDMLNRVIVPARERANELLAAQGRPSIAHLTPHTLRRTFASLLAVCNVPPRRAMYLLGHTDAKLTLSVYQQVLDVGPGSVELIEQVLGTSLDEARDVLCGHAARAGVLVVNA